MKDQKDVAKKVIEYIDMNLEKEIDLDNIAKSVGYSKFYLNLFLQSIQELQFTDIYRIVDLLLLLKNWLKQINQ